MTGTEARNAYKRRWNKENKEKVKAAQRKYWEKKAENAEPGTTAADLKMLISAAGRRNTRTE